MHRQAGHATHPGLADAAKLAGVEAGGVLVTRACKSKVVSSRGAGGLRGEEEGWEVGGGQLDGAAYATPV